MQDEGRPQDEVPGHPGSLAWSVLFFGFGIAAGLLIAFAGFGFVADSAGAIIAAFLVGLVVVGFAGLMAALFRRPILRRLFGVTQTQLELFAKPLARVAERAAERDATGATAAARDLVALALARYAWVTTRRWIVASLTALIAAMAALAGTALLFQQNRLIAAQSALLVEQNARVAEQTELLRQDVQLAEASRNAALAPQIVEIAADLGAAAATAMAGFDSPTVNVLNPATDLDRALILRIVTLSRSLRPYRFLDLGTRLNDRFDGLRVAMAAQADRLPATYARMAAAFGWTPPRLAADVIDRPASPERGQLLDALLAGGVRDLNLLTFGGLDLAYAYLQAAEIGLVQFHHARLSYADLSGGWITEADFGGATLVNARFRNAVILRSTFAPLDAARVRPPFRAADAPFPTFASGADFAGAVIRDSSFAGATLTAAVFDGALLAGVDMTGAELSAASLQGAVLAGVRLDGAGVKSADFDGAIVFGTDFLDRLAAAGPDAFNRTAWTAEPVTLDAVMALFLVDNTLWREEVTALTGGAQPMRIRRVQPWESPP